MRTLAPPPISVFEYDNYRQFLKDSYERLKSHDNKYSFRYFSKLAGFKSSSVLKMIMDGKRNMGSGAIEQFSRALKLNADEAAFFRFLVLFNQAKTADEKQSYAQALMHFSNFKRNYPLTEAQYNFYACWYTPVIWELAGVPGFKDDPEWIAKRIKPNLTVPEVRKALAELEQLGLLERTPDGHLKKTKVNLRTANEVVSSAIAQWHREMIRRAGESIDSVPREQRDISSITCSMSLETAQKIKEKVQKLRKELLEIVSQDPSPTVVYQLNFQLFPQTEIEDDDLPCKKVS